VQVHEVVDLATSDAPPLRHTVDDIVGSGRRAQRHRRAGWVAAGGAGFAVVAVAATVALPQLTSRPDRTTGAAPAAATSASKKAGPAAFAAADPFTFTFQGFDAGKFHVQDPIVASTAYQIAPVYADGFVSNDRAVDPGDLAQSGSDPAKYLKQRRQQMTLWAYLTLYRPGAFDPAGVKGGQSLTVDGHPALQTVGKAGTGEEGNRTLAWQYAKNAWATVSTYSRSATDPSAKDIEAVVSGLKPAEPAPAKLPFSMSYVPSGYKAVESGTHAMSGLDGIASAREGDFGGAMFAKPALPTTGLTAPYGTEDGAELPGTFKIFVVPSGNSNQLLHGKKPPAQPKCSNGFCNRWTSDGKVQVQVASGGRLSDAEMSRIAKGIKLANVNDDGTWFEASKALQFTP
jgi:hypothetical protein